MLVRSSRGELPTAGVVPSAEVIDAAVRASALSAAADVLVRVASELPGEPPRVVARIGAAAEGILATAGDESPILLALGTRGRGALASTVLGSASAGLLHRSGCPVLAVPDGAEPEPPGRLLAAVAPGDDHVTQFAMRMAEMLGARLTLAHAVPSLLGDTGVGAPLASARDPGDAGFACPGDCTGRERPRPQVFSGGMPVGGQPGARGPRNSSPDWTQT